MRSFPLQQKSNQSYQTIIKYPKPYKLHQKTKNQNTSSFNLSLPMASRISKKLLNTALSVADAASWSCALALVALILMSSLHDHNPDHEEENAIIFKGGSLIRQMPCDEIYVVSEGETLNSISDKCDDPFIVERNPHIHDPDDVFPGLVIMITPSAKLKSIMS
ncbi:hypothetical protein LUZ60_014665 [Juncus effusus]|nr:hypothetical protein LUZ60_014665 [Juncus effusus]